jgi:uncharacterized protein (TIGR00369 family)
MTSNALDLEATRARIRESFGRQALMATMGATLGRIDAGEVEVWLPFDRRLTQQHGFLHAATIAAIADNACGYAALSMMQPDASVLSVEFKVNLLAPAAGERFVALGQVVRAGKTITVTRADVHAHAGDAKPKLVATMLATMIRAEARDGHG